MRQRSRVVVPGIEARCAPPLSATKPTRSSGRRRRERRPPTQPTSAPAALAAFETLRACVGSKRDSTLRPAWKRRLSKRASPPSDAAASAGASPDVGAHMSALALSC